MSTKRNYHHLELPESFDAAAGFLPLASASDWARMLLRLFEGCNWLFGGGCGLIEVEKNAEDELNRFRRPLKIIGHTMITLALVDTPMDCPV